MLGGNTHIFGQVATTFGGRAPYLSFAGRMVEADNGKTYLTGGDFSIWLFDEQTKEPQPFVVLAFAAPFDPAEVVKTNMPDAKSQKVGGKTVYTSATFPDAAVYFPPGFSYQVTAVSPDPVFLAYTLYPASR